MLQQNATPPATLELLKKICAIQELMPFGLGGGTSLALRIGHRLSIDLDFFINSNFNTGQYSRLLPKTFHLQSYCLNKIKR
jgi:hypothetical protein